MLATRAVHTVPREVEVQDRKPRLILFNENVARLIGTPLLNAPGIRIFCVSKGELPVGWAKAELMRGIRVAWMSLITTVVIHAALDDIVDSVVETARQLRTVYSWFFRKRESG